jgi:hypothetical protein
MAGGGGGGTQTTRVEPPSWQLPYLQYGAGQAQNLYDSGGTKVVPFSGDTRAGLGMITARATGGSPINQASEDLATKTLEGGFLGSNPYLDQTFNRAALQTQNQLASQFARSGRNVEASEGLRGQQLNDLATGIYGGAYDAERNRQQQVLGMAPGLASSQYMDADRLLGVGAAREDYEQRVQDNPGRNLDEFLQRVGGNYGQTNIATGSRNRGAGALGGAMMGSQFAGQFSSNPWAQGLGALGGGYLGGWG